MRLVVLTFFVLIFFAGNSVLARLALAVTSFIFFALPEARPNATGFGLAVLSGTVTSGLGYDFGILLSGKFQSPRRLSRSFRFRSSRR